MATETQITANRSNAQKSTGPRTPEGKAIVAQNAVKHGFLAQEVVIKGEDPGEFELYRDGMLEELAPAGQMESMLAERIVGLAWRLRRAEKLQAATFDTLPEEKKKWGWSDKDNQWIVPQKPQPGSEAERLEFGQRIVHDFAQTRILDRLLVYERRIEYSLYRTMAELRNLRKEGRGEGAKVRRSEAQTVLPSPVGTFSASSSVPPSPDGVAMNRAEGQGRLCETNPISADPAEDQVPSDARVEEVGRGRPTYEESPDSVATNVPEAQEPSCETKPIGEGIGVQGGAPIAMNRDWEPRSGASDLTPDTRPLTPEPSCETKPIGAGTEAQERGISSLSPDPRPLTPEPLCKTKPISARKIKDGEGYRPIFRRH